MTKPKTKSDPVCCLRPLLENGIDHDLAAVANRIIDDGWYFGGLAPKEVVGKLCGPAYSNRVTDVQLSDYWIWSVDQEMRYLCYAVRFRRATGTKRASKLKLTNRLNEFMKRTGASVRTLE